jgi:hypothetical protein
MLLSDSVGGADESRNGFWRSIPVKLTARWIDMWSSGVATPFSRCVPGFDVAGVELRTRSLEERRPEKLLLDRNGGDYCGSGRAGGGAAWVRD